VDKTKDSYNNRVFYKRKIGYIIVARQNVVAGCTSVCASPRIIQVKCFSYLVIITMKFTQLKYSHNIVGPARLDQNIFKIFK
jgi:hypothetical protein